jgi:glutamyl-tRNA reductase
MNNGNSVLTVAGVNFRNTSVEIRSRFAFTNEGIRKIYQDESYKHLQDFFILSTCNRTEIYSTATYPETLLQVLAGHKGLGDEEIRQYAFVKTGDEAVKHLFKVAAGLDSQIIGDHEIIGQLKNAFVLAKTYNRTSGFMEKLVNSALQASRQVKSRTSLSDGTTSVSYAVIQLLKQYISNTDAVHVCLLGLGKIGTLTLKNLRHYLPQHRVTLVNRNSTKAEIAAGEFNIDYAPFENQQDVLNKADILIVATGADHPIITAAEIEAGRVRMIFDLSVPSNVDPAVARVQGVQLFNIDELSQIVNSSIEARRTEIPLAESIINEHFDEFRQWEWRREKYSAQAAGKSELLRKVA